MTAMDQLDRSYWESRYLKEEIGWDIGYPSTPIKEYVDTLKRKDIKVLVPGAGNSYEAEYMHNQGFKNVYVIDLTPTPYERLKKACPEIDESKLLVGDFFEHVDQYDLIIEQTFFCALDPTLRSSYVEHMHRLLKPNGLLVGVLFDDPLFSDRPPFGGSRAEYKNLFEEKFDIVKMETAYNSIPPRSERELFIKLQPKTFT